ncbi:hypothetical protein I2F29_08570 [Acinetobacter sp. FNA3]|nr:hypothetical protein [Acinetobacter pollinis]MBF7700960.1 hypothetical protein [Acinetobacter pollinis]
MKSFKSDHERESFANRCGTSLGYLKAIMYGNRKCNPILAINIDRESEGNISCDNLCPEADFEYVRQKSKNQLTA